MANCPSCGHAPHGEDCALCECIEGRWPTLAAANARAKKREARRIIREAIEALTEDDLTFIHTADSPEELRLNLLALLA